MSTASSATHAHYMPASALTPAPAGTGRGSQQGKYKDIVLMDVNGDEIPMKRKNRTTSDDASPDEKRRRFLERNRYYKPLIVIFSLKSATSTQ